MVFARRSIEGTIGRGFVLLRVEHRRQTLQDVGKVFERIDAAIIYSVLISCQSHGIDPATYLQEVLAKDTRVLPEDQLAALTPAKWKKPSVAEG